MTTEEFGALCAAYKIELLVALLGFGLGLWFASNVFTILGVTITFGAIAGILKFIFERLER